MNKHEKNEVSAEQAIEIIKMLAETMLIGGLYEEDMTRLGYKIFRYINNNFVLDEYVISGGDEGWKYLGKINLSAFRNNFFEKPGGLDYD